MPLRWWVLSCRGTNVFDEVKMPNGTPPGMEQDGGRKMKVSFDVSRLTQSEIINLMNRCREALPPTQLAHMNLEEELVMQYRTVQALQQDTLEDNFIEPNKKASVVNACATALAHLVKLQTELHTAERFKAIEGLMIKAIKKLPQDVMNEFLDEYERMGLGDKQ